jgi:hypothetical protein
MDLEPMKRVILLGPGSRRHCRGLQKCACDCANGVPVGKCIYDLLSSGERAELCVVALWLMAMRL